MSMRERIGRVVFIAALAALALGGAGEASGQKVNLDVGARAPEFEAIADDGELWQSYRSVGEKYLVVYFYPAALTGGCTRQACAFRDDRTKLREMGAEVVGISGDPVENLQIFKKAHRLNFPLLSDPEGEIAAKFGVPVRQGGTVTQKVEGREVTLGRDVTTARWTFIIGPDGRIAFRNTEVDAAGDSKAVIAALRKLQQNG